MVYFIRFKAEGPIKIGQTINLKRRLGCYSSELGRDVEVLGVMDGGRKIEKWVLQKFDHLRVSTSVVSEWRNPGPDLLEFIKTTCRPWSEEDDAPGYRQEYVCHMKADERVAPAIREWVAELASFAYLNIPMLLDVALIHYAKSIGFTKKKPKRQMTKRKAL